MMLPLKVNNLEIRLAETEREIAMSQSLRFQVFYNEMGAKPSQKVQELELDFDPYDAFCDHLLVIDLERGSIANPFVVGTSRLLKGAVAEDGAGFYSKSEFDLQALLRRSPQVLELGRSCINSEYRCKGTMQLLWRGIAEYVFEHSIKYLFGCASIPGTDPAAVRQPLAYLYHYHLAPSVIRTHALDQRFVAMDVLPKDAVDVGQALRELPPLIKGYIRLGGVVGDGAVIDYDFKSIDVNMIVETASVTEKYLNHFTREVANASANRTHGQRPSGAIAA